MARRKVFGPKVVVTDGFRRSLETWLKMPGHSGRQLAKAIGCNQSMISQLVNKPDDVKASTLVIPICQQTGIPLPTEVLDDEAALLTQMRQLRDVDKKTFDAIVALISARLGR